MDNINKTWTTLSENIKYVVKVKLHDECDNGVYGFSITYDGYEKKGINEWEWFEGGANTEKCAMLVPELSPYVNLHLCNCHGQPMYPIENGMYHLKHDIVKGAEYLRCTMNEAKVLELAVKADDKIYFQYLLEHLGIIKRWQEEADRFIVFLTKDSGCKWENPYEGKEKHCLQPLSDDVKNDIMDKIKSGYYDKKQIIKRQNDKFKEQLDSDLEACEKTYKDAIRVAKNILNASKYILDKGISKRNFFVYWNDDLSYSAVTIRPAWNTTKTEWDEILKKWYACHEDFCNKFGMKNEKIEELNNY